MRVEKHCDDNVIIVYDFLTPEECFRLSTWLEAYSWDLVPVHQVKFWKQRLTNEHTASSVPKLTSSFDSVKDITNSLVDRLILALSQADEEKEWSPNPLAYIKMFPGSNPNEDIKQGLEMFYHIDNQLHMTTIIEWGSVIYTNDNYEGGSIDYPEYKFSYKPVAGSLVLHSGYTTHGVKEMISGTRFCITSLITEKNKWNPAPLPTSTPGGGGEAYIYPSGYWGKRMKDDPIQGDIKLLRPDGTTALYQSNPDLAVKIWNLKYRYRPK